jgi:hypothetical protein
MRRKVTVFFDSSLTKKAIAAEVSTKFTLKSFISKLSKGDRQFSHFLNYPR